MDRWLAGQVGGWWGQISRQMDVSSDGKGKDQMTASRDYWAHPP